MMEKSIPVIFILLCVLLAFSCQQTLESQYGTLTVNIEWQSEPAAAISEKGNIKRSGGKAGMKDTMDKSGLNNVIDNSISKIHLRLQPGDILFEFELDGSVISAEVDLGIYNICVQALDDNNVIIYSGTAEKILVESFEITTITIQMQANFPCQAPHFIGLSEENISNSGTFPLQWSTTGKASLYRLEESADSIFTTVSMIYSGPDTVFTIENRPEGGYYYRVRGENESGISPWSEWAFFKVELIEELIIITSSLDSCTVNEFYNKTITARGGTTPYTWSVVSGELPEGLSLNAETGQISGTAGTPGTSFFSVRVVDSSDPQQEDTRGFVITVNPEDLIITTSTPLPDAAQGILYSENIEALGGTTPYTWSVVSGELPEGLSLNAETGQISGTAGTPGTSFFSVRVVDSSDPQQEDTREFAITVNPEDLIIITSTPLPDAAQGILYSENIEALGGSTDWSWTMTEGTLPQGITFSDFGETGRVQGTPTETGTFNFSIQVTDNVYSTLTDVKSFSLTVDAFSGLQITTPSTLPNAKAGVAYAKQIRATGGTPPYVWTEISRTPASLAEGISLGSTGWLTGTSMCEAHSGQIRVRVTDSGSPPETDTKTFNFTITTGDLELFSAYLPDGEVGVSYDGYICYRLGTSPLESPWTITGDVPMGLTMSYYSSNYQLYFSGTPVEGGTFVFSVTVRDSGSPAQTRTDSFSITINP